MLKLKNNKNKSNQSGLTVNSQTLNQHEWNMFKIYRIFIFVCQTKTKEI